MTNPSTIHALFTDLFQFRQTVFVSLHCRRIPTIRPLSVTNTNVTITIDVFYQAHYSSILYDLDLMIVLKHRQFSEYVRILFKQTCILHMNVFTNWIAYSTNKPKGFFRPS